MGKKLFNVKYSVGTCLVFHALVSLIIKLNFKYSNHHALCNSGYFCSRCKSDWTSICEWTWTSLSSLFFPLTKKGSLLSRLLFHVPWYRAPSGFCSLHYTFKGKHDCCKSMNLQNLQRKITAKNIKIDHTSCKSTEEKGKGNKRKYSMWSAWNLILKVLNE